MTSAHAMRKKRNVSRGQSFSYLTSPRQTITVIARKTREMMSIVEGYHAR
jgi:hypothetical protein